MSPVLLHIYGPFAIQSFGLMIAIGLIIVLYLLDKDAPLQQLVSENQLHKIIQISLIAGIAGGRIWFLITNPIEMNHWFDYFTVWSGGLSILGAIIGIITTLSLYLSFNRIPILPLLDRLTLYAPLLQSISRFGCFFAGCCHGIPTTLPWGIMYTHPDSLAPINIIIHPTQIYSSIGLLIIFVILHYFDSFKNNKSGQISTLYIMLTSMERFISEFWRGDTEFLSTQKDLQFLSVQQMLAVTLFIGALFTFIFITINKKTDESI